MLMLDVVRAVSKTAVRRWRRGARRPGWRFPVEMLITFMQDSNRRTAHLGMAERRVRMDELSLPSPLLKRIHQEPLQAGGVPAKWFTPREGSTEGVLLYFHGGGYCIGSTRSHAALIARLALDSGTRALALDYRLAPEHPFPAAVEDAVAAYRWLLSTGVRPEQVVLAGDSAGGGLSLATLLSLRQQELPLPAGAVLLSPWVDLTCDKPSLAANTLYDLTNRDTLALMARSYLGETDPREPLASPLYADLRGLPPLYIQAGEVETLVDEIKELADVARGAGVSVQLDVWPGMPHVFQFFDGMLPESTQALDRLGRNIRGLLQPPAMAASAWRPITEGRTG